MGRSLLSTIAHDLGSGGTRNHEQDPDTGNSRVSDYTSAGGTVFDLSAVIGGDGIIAELSRCQKLFGHLPSSSAAGTDGLTTYVVLYGDSRI